MEKKQRHSGSLLKRCQVRTGAYPCRPLLTILICHKDVAELVLQNCTSVNAENGRFPTGAKEFEATFNYEFLEDSENAMK